MVQRVRYFAVKFLIFLVSYLIRVSDETTRSKERPNSLPYRTFEVDSPLKEALVEVDPL